MLPGLRQVAVSSNLQLFTLRPASRTCTDWRRRSYFGPASRTCAQSDLLHGLVRSLSVKAVKICVWQGVVHLRFEVAAIRSKDSLQGSTLSQVKDPKSQPKRWKNACRWIL